MREKGDKGIQKWNRKFRDILLVFNIFFRPFSAKNVVELIEKIKNTLRSKSKSPAIHQKKIKFNKKNRSINAIISRERRINYSQKRKILYLSID